MATIAKTEYASFMDFYPDYLAQHSNRVCRELHFAGSTLAIICVGAMLLTGSLWWLLAAAFCSRAFAWVGHHLYEKTSLATYRHPIYTFVGDWVMYWQMLTGQASF